MVGFLQLQNVVGYQVDRLVRTTETHHVFKLSWTTNILKANLHVITDHVVG
jgi:hypothetical protein